jgi:hypothetical protein
VNGAAGAWAVTSSLFGDLANGGVWVRAGTGPLGAHDPPARFLRIRGGGVVMAVVDLGKELDRDGAGRIGGVVPADRVRKGRCVGLRQVGRRTEPVTGLRKLVVVGEQGKLDDPEAALRVSKWAITVGSILRGSWVGLPVRVHG